MDILKVNADIIQRLKERQGARSLHEFSLEIGLSVSYLSELFRGTRNPGPKVLKALNLTLTVTEKGGTKIDRKLPRKSSAGSD